MFRNFISHQDDYQVSHLILKLLPTSTHLDTKSLRNTEFKNFYIQGILHQQNMHSFI